MSDWIDTLLLGGYVAFRPQGFCNFFKEGSYSVVVLVSVVLVAPELLASVLFP